MVGWGNTAGSNWRKVNIRQAKQGDARVDVHYLIKPMTERLLAALADAGYDTKAAKPGPDENGTSIIVVGNPVTPAAGERVADIADGLGFVQRTPGRWQFVATADWAAGKIAEYAQHEAAAEAEPWQPTPVEGVKPGSRTIGDGDTGVDVRTVQAFLDCPITGTWDETTQIAMVEYRALNRLPLAAVADADFWVDVLPRRVTWKRVGEGGKQIRIAESALIGFGYMEAPATGRFGVRMARALRAARAAAGIPGTVKLDTLTWRLLFDLGYAEAAAEDRRTHQGFFN